MTPEEIVQKLFAMQDMPYRDFHAKLIPNVAKDRIIGIRTPQMRKFASELTKGGESAYADFVRQLPHKYYDENQLHAFLISQIKDFQKCIDAVTLFLPHIDNWATSDQLLPRVFKSHKAELLPHIRMWLQSAHTYTVRFAVGMLMTHFLDEDYSPEYSDLVASIHSEEYYINMMLAWYFSVALVKHYEETLPYLTQNRLGKWVHNKTIQKAVESYRIDETRKAALKQLRRKE